MDPKKFAPDGPAHVKFGASDQLQNEQLFFGSKAMIG